MTQRKIGISTGSLQRRYGDMGALQIAKNAGADAVDFSLYQTKEYDVKNPESVYGKSDEEIISHFTKIKNYAEEIGIEICQTHGRITGFKNIKAEDDVLVENIKRDLLSTKALGAPVCVVHTTTTIHMGVDCEPKLMQDLDFEMFTRVLPYAKQYGVKLATETFGDAANFNACDFFGNINEFIKAYNRVCAVEDYKNYFTICMDTGHSNKAQRFNGNPSAADVIRMLGSNISVLHLNDNDSIADQHKIPLSGNIDWNDVFDALDEVGYQGVYNMEVDLRWYGEELMQDSAAFAVKVMRNILDNRYK